MTIIGDTAAAPRHRPDPLDGLEPPDLPADRPRAAAGGPRDRVPVPVPGFAAGAAAHGVDAAGLALAGVRLLLSRYARGADVAVAVAVDGAAPVVVRADLSGDPAVGAFLPAPVASGDVPAAGDSRVPVALSIGDGPVPDGFELVFRLTGDVLALDYPTARCERATAERVAGHLANLVTGLAAAPADTPVADLDMLGAAERETLLRTWNDTAAAAPDATVHGLVERAAAANPDAVAVTGEAGSLTYAELDARANRLAHHLRALGAGRETPVGVCLDRGPGLVTALLAVLKAGAAYVFLDAGLPAERLEFMLADTAAPVVVTDAAHAGAVPAGPVPVLLDGDADAIAARPASAPQVASGADDLAFVIYTSGSTGTPKGVMLEHRSTVAFLSWCGERYGRITAMAQVATAAFDAFTFECWTALAQGASLVILGKDTALSSDAVAAALREHEVSTLLMTSALFHQHLVERPDVFDGLTAVLFGGEAIDRAAVDRLAAGPHAPDTIAHVYGPTEATTFVTDYRVRAGRHPETASLPIGGPIANTELYVVDAAMRPVPVGVPGELLIGGIGLARGYLNRPELTAEKFVPHPFSDTPGARVYRTGDLVKWLPDGNVEFLGRIDHQVKIRGMRIELGEIETAILAEGQAASATVLVREDTPGDKRLTAYIVPTHDTYDTTTARETLAERLPSYMIPTAFISLDAIPLTPNGKVDRRALPAPAAGRDALTADYTPPATGTERALAAIWAEVLGTGPVGATDDFAELGGHSLLATRVVSRVRDRLGVAVTVKDLFAAPTVRGLAAVLDDAPASAAGPEPIPSTAHEGGAPPSFAQERLWFLDQLRPGGAEYVVPFAFRVRGPLDLAALETAVSGLVARHEVLRTRFTVDAEGVPVQIPGPAAPVTAEVFPAAGLTEARARLRERARDGFDLAAGPLLRLAVARLSDADHVVLLAVHHIACDGWSAGLIAGELRDGYAAALAGREPDRPPLPVQYADYAIWQRDRSAGDGLDGQVAYWTERLAGLEPLELSTDRPRPATPSAEGGSVRVTLTPGTVRGLAALAAAHGASPFMAGLAAFQVLLSRYARQTDIAVGTPIAGRTHTDVEDLVGFFVNTLVLRTDLSGDPTVGELLEQVRDHALDAYANQDLPFERLVDHLAPDRDLTRNPLTQVLFAGQNVAGLGAWDLPGLDVAEEHLHNGTCTVDLSVFCVDRPDGSMDVEFVYATDLFTAPTVERMARHYATLMGALAEAGADSRVAALDMAGAAERHRVLVEWNDTGRDIPAGATVHGLVAAVAERHPDRIAVSHGGEAITYAELNTRANRLAHHLQALGVAPGDLVGVSLDRGIALVVVLLGILKAGGAYAPLDVDYPAERLEFMLADTAAPVVVTDAATGARLPRTAARLVEIDGDAAAIAARPGHDPAECTGPDGLAYINYTSGSTGTPKGVLIEHLAVNRLVHSTYADIGPEDVIAQVSTPSFDAYTFEAWGALTRGAAMAVIDKDTALSADAFHAALRREGVTAMFLTSALFNQHLQERPDVFADLTWILYGGEAIDRTAVDRLVAGPHAPANTVHVYGPTETTTFATSFTVTPDRHADTATVPIGGPIANTELYVVDAAMRPVPVGVPGELLIGGIGLARGYLNRPELTAEKFVPHPFSDTPGARVYRTGDLVKWLPDGNVEFLGRIDHQVKIRGMRIELGEIETAILAEGQAASATVLVREDTPGDKRLTAYIVPTHDTYDTTTARETLAERLPSYMIPAAFVPMAALPLNTNGKIDKRALPAPDPGHDAGSRAYEPPEGPVEEALASLWASILGVERVGAADDFFALGGHSLLATRVVSGVRRDLGAALSVRDVFAAPTVRGLAALVAAAETGALDRIPVAARVEDPPASFAQARLWFLDQMDPGGRDYLVPYGMRVRGRLDLPALESAVSGLVARHEVLRTGFGVDAAGDPVQRIAAPNPVHAVLIDARDAAHARAVLTEHGRRGIDLATGEMLRLVVARVSDEDHHVLLLTHHIASDGWSTPILARELEELYAAALAGREPRLPALPVQYADYAVWQRDRLAGPETERQLAYWAERLAGLEPLDLPTDRPRPAVRTGAGGTVAFRLDAATAAGLKRLAAAHGASLFMTGLAAFQILLSRYARQTDIAVGTPIAGRTHTDVENLVGFFVNTLVLRADLSGDPTVGAFLEQVRDHALDAYANQDLPFERLVDHLAPDRDLARNPLFQAMFILQNEGEGADGWRLPGCAVEAVPIETGAAKFDLTLTLADHDDGLHGTLDYSGDVFDRDTAERIAGHFTALAASMAGAGDDTGIGDLDLMTPGERHRVLNEWNGERVDWAGPDTVHGLVEAVAAANPDATAVVAGGEAITYAELDARAERLAARLRVLGAGPGTLVAVCLGRTPALIPALLGVLKSGAAYVPLDPAYPPARLEFMLADSAAPLLVTDAESAARLPLNGSGTTVVDVDAEPDAPAPEASTPAPGAGPRDLAYVVYTSGSTGKPKGVAVEHRGVVNYLRHLDRDILDGRAPGVVAQAASVAYDSSVREIFGALATGSALHLVPEGMADPEKYAAALADLGANVVPSCVPSVLAEVLAAGARPRLGTVLVSGESPAALRPHAAAVEERIGELVNHYGPTECTMTTVFHRGHRLGDGDVIGRPMANAKAYVVDAAMRPVPVGVPGELLIGGAGVARGYWNRPEATAGKFLPDPFDPGPDARVFRTGDLVRWRPDGTLEFRGRLDAQVKLRGQRIEPGEIEAAVLAAGGAESCVAAVRDGRLVAYVVPAAAWDAAGTRAAVAARLPEYMVPAVFVPLDALPLLPNGKIDRAALPEPAAAVPETAYEPPRTPAERRIARAWAEVLDLDRVGVHDDFFALGGHSLLATRVVSRLRKDFGVDVPVRALFAAPTVAGLARDLAGLVRARVQERFARR